MRSTGSAATRACASATLRWRTSSRATTEIAAGGDPTAAEALAAADADAVRDDLLRLLATTCHPALSPDARVALTLRLLGGLTTAEIARAFLVPEPTVAQRISRAKATLAGHAYAEASVADLEARIGGVLEVHLPRVQRGPRRDRAATRSCARTCAARRSGSPAWSPSSSRTTRRRSACSP